MTLELNGLEVDCVIGERPDERTRLQRLRLDLVLEIGGRAAETDELTDTVDYAALAEEVRQALVEAKCQMIERAARIALDVCLKDGKVGAAKVKVTKTGAVPHLESASVTLEGGRQDG